MREFSHRANSRTFRRGSTKLREVPDLPLRCDADNWGGYGYAARAPISSPQRPLAESTRDTPLPQLRSCVLGDLQVQVGELLILIQN